MLLLQRAAETVSGDDECNDPAVLLACALGSTGCPAKCAEAEKNNTDQNPNNAFNGVIAGDLSVAVSTSTSTVSIPNDGIVKVAELAVKASEDIQLQSIDVTRLGLSNNEGVKVWIEKDGKRITSSSSFFGDSKASLTFNNGGYVVKGDETLDLVVSLDKAKVEAGSEFQFKVSNVVSSAKNVTVSPDTTGTFRTAVYTATSLTIVSSTQTSPRSYNLANDTTFSFGEFKVQNDSKASMEKDVMIKSITFKVEGSIENLTNFKLLRDSKEVSSKYTIDGKSLTFAVNDQLDSGKSATYKVTAEPTNIESTNGDNYTLSIKKAEDVIAEEIGSNSTAYRVSVKEIVKTSTSNPVWTDDWDVVSLGQTTIKGGNITLTRDSSLASTVSADWGYTDVVIAKGTMKTNQAVKFDNMTLAATAIKDSTNANLAPANGLKDIVRRATLVIDGKSYQAEIKANNDLYIGSEIYLSKGDHNVELQISLVNSEVKVGNAAVAKITFKAIDKSVFGVANYTNGDETAFDANTQIAGTIRVSDVTIQQKKITVKKSGPSEDIKVSQGNTDEKVLLVGEITNSADKDLEINKFTVEVDANDNTSTAGITYWDVYASIGDASSSVYSISKAQSASIDSMTTVVEPGKTVKFEIRIIPDANLKAAHCADGSDADQTTCTTTNSSTWVVADNFKFNVTVAGKLDGNDTSSSALKTAKVTATAGASSSIVANTTDNKQIIKPGVSTKVASFNYNVKNDSIDVNKLYLKVAGFNADNLDDLTVDFGGSVGAPGLTYKSITTTTTNDTIEVEFSNVVTLPEANYKVNVYATFNDNAIDVTKTVTVSNVGVVNDTTKKQAEKQILWVAINSNTSFSALSFKHYVAKAYPILSVKDKNTTKDNERLDINVRKSNDEGNTVQLVGLAPANNGATTPVAITWSVAEWAETNYKIISLDANSATVLRTRTPMASVTSINFVVTDDEGNTVYYEGVDAGSDFASLSL